MCKKVYKSMRILHKFPLKMGHTKYAKSTLNICVKNNDTLCIMEYKICVNFVGKINDSANFKA